MEESCVLRLIRTSWGSSERCAFAIDLLQPAHRHGQQYPQDTEHADQESKRNPSYSNGTIAQLAFSTFIKALVAETKHSPTPSSESAADEVLGNWVYR